MTRLIGKPSPATATRHVGIVTATDCTVFVDDSADAFDEYGEMFTGLGHLVPGKSCLAQCLGRGGAMLRTNSIRAVLSASSTVFFPFRQGLSTSWENVARGQSAARP